MHLAMNIDWLNNPDRAFAIKTIWLNPNNVTIVVAFAPTSSYEERIESLSYGSGEALRRRPSLLQSRCQRQDWIEMNDEEQHIGIHGLEWNEQGERLLELEWNEQGVRLSEFIMSTLIIRGNS
ncbi:hypothetical protein V3C99_007932 [Haemonchus contortus]|uniref:DUF3110 domain-containing protein n=1 Tax=Haemonchus contortus TaxID=6289 RepID=A0A7I5EBB0_HAECO